MLKINFYEGRIMKKLDKQIVSALAIGIGAGLMMCPVTAYADEGEPDENNNDDPVTTQAGDEQKSEENSEVQETAEAAEAISEAATAVDSAQDAVPTAPAGETNGYEGVNAALNSAENQINNAATELGDAQDALDTAQRDIETAGAQDKIVDDKAIEIENDYDKTISGAQDAVDIIEGIDTVNDSIETAETAVSNAQKIVEDAEKSFSDAESAEKEAAAASGVSNSALDNIEAQKNAYDEQIEAAEQDLGLAETALITAANDLTEKQSAAEIALSNLEGELGKKIDDLRKAISGADAWDKQNKVNELGEFIVENYVLTTDEDKAAFADGTISFTYSINEDGNIVITKTVTTSIVHHAGYFNEYGNEMDESHYDKVISDTDEETGKKAAYGYRESDNEIIARRELEPYLADVVNEDGTEWRVIGYTDDVEHFLRDEITTCKANGYDGDAVRKLYYKVYETTDYRKITAYTSSAQSQADTAEQEARSIYNKDVIEKEFKEKKQYEGWEISEVRYTTKSEEEFIARPSYRCYVEVIISRCGDDQRFESSEVFYKADRYDYVGEWTETISDENEISAAEYADSMSAAVEEYNAKSTAAQATLDKAKAATTAYNSALEKVTSAREKVKALTGSFVSSDEVEKVKNAHTAALANLESAKEKKILVQNKLGEAKDALNRAADKIKAIDERVKSAQQAAQNNDGNDQGGDVQAENSDNGNNVTPGGTNTDHGSGNGDSSNNKNKEAVVAPVAFGANPTVTRTAPITQRAQMSKLAQSLSEEVLRISDAERSENKTDISKVTASTDADSKAGKNVSKAFTSSVDGAVANIEDEETALSATAENNSMKFPIIFALLGAIVAGVSVSEYFRKKKEEEEM